MKRNWRSVAVSACTVFAVSCAATASGENTDGGQGGGAGGAAGGGSASGGGFAPGGGTASGGGFASGGGSASGGGFASGGGTAQGGGAGGFGGGAPSGGGTGGSGGGVAGGSGGSAGGGTVTGIIADLRADVNRDGVTSLSDGADDANEDTWDSTHGAIFLANLDVDDPARCVYSPTLSDDALAACHDASDELINGADDLADMAVLRVAPWSTSPVGALGTLSVPTAAVPYVRFFKKSGTTYTVFRPGTDTFSATELRAGVEVRLEGRDIARRSTTWDGFVDVKLIAQSPAMGGTPLSQATDTVRLRVAPVVLFHHLLPAVDTYVTHVPAGAGSTRLSDTFVSSLQNILNGVGMGSTLHSIGTADLWAQDFFETGFMAMPGAGGVPHVIRVNLRSANVEQPNSSGAPLRSAGRIVFVMRGKDVAAVQQYDRNTPGSMQSLNSFGNTETVPPYSLAGANYPLGRIIRGSIPSFYTDKSFTVMLESQKVQPPIYIDTSWLLVGHVDETISFVKAATPRGWVLLVNDPRLAIQTLQTMVSNGQGSVKMFTGMYWPDFTGQTNKYTPAAISAAGVLADTDVMTESTASAAEVDAQLAIIKAATGLTDAEIIRVPYLHMPIDGASLAYQPGTVNGFYVNDTTFISPMPHGPVVNSKDVFADQLESALSAKGITVKWVDDWDLYHTNMGEVHCATNAARALPQVRWWETGR